MDGNGTTNLEEYRQLTDGASVTNAIVFNPPRLSIGAGHCVALRKDGSLWAWGYNSYGQIGDGTLQMRPYPVAGPTNRIWLSVEASGGTTWALGTDGTLWGWGDNRSGDIGNGVKNVYYRQPVQGPTNRVWRSITCFGGRQYAIAVDGTLWAWGLGPLGDGTWSLRMNPIQIGRDQQWNAISTSYNHTLAVGRDGSLWAWGQNGNGELGDGTTLTRLTPVRVASQRSWVAAAAASDYSLALAGDGTLWVWGGYRWIFGETTGPDTQKNPLPAQIAKQRKWASISAPVGLGTVFLLATDGSLWALGSNRFGEFGDGSGVLTEPTQIGKERLWTTVVASGEDSYARVLALAHDGTLWNLGEDRFELSGTNYVNHGFEQVGTRSDWKTVVTRTRTTFAVSRDGLLWGWGANDYGQIGDGTRNFRPRPVRVAFDLSVKSVSASNNHTVVLAEDGTLWTWGWLPGQPEVDPASNFVLKPVQIGRDKSWTAVSSADSRTMAVASDGSIWGRGRNSGGELGDGTLLDSGDLRRVKSDQLWSSVSCAYDCTLAIARDGSLWGWGTPLFFPRSIRLDILPTRLPLLNHVREIAAGGDAGLEVVAIGVAGEVLRLRGLFVTEVKSADGTQDMAVRAISAGGISIALSDGGTAICWGDNQFGQLGNGTANPRGFGTRVVGVRDWVSVSAGDRHVFAVGSDGTLWTWGGLEAGYRGNGLMRQIPGGASYGPPRTP